MRPALGHPHTGTVHMEASSHSALAVAWTLSHICRARGVKAFNFHRLQFFESERKIRVEFFFSSDYSSFDSEESLCCKPGSLESRSLSQEQWTTAPRGPHPSAPTGFLKFQFRKQRSTPVPVYWVGSCKAVHSQK